jgi:hypothetical protein
MPHHQVVRSLLPAIQHMLELPAVSLTVASSVPDDFKEPNTASISFDEWKKRVEQHLPANACILPNGHLGKMWSKDGLLCPPAGSTVIDLGIIATAARVDGAPTPPDLHIVHHLNFKDTTAAATRLATLAQAVQQARWGAGSRIHLLISDAEFNPAEITTIQHVKKVLEQYRVSMNRQGSPLIQLYTYPAQAVELEQKGQNPQLKPISYQTLMQMKSDRGYQQVFLAQKRAQGKNAIAAKGTQSLLNFFGKKQAPAAAPAAPVPPAAPLQAASPARLQAGFFAPAAIAAEAAGVQQDAVFALSQVENIKPVDPVDKQQPAAPLTPVRKRDRDIVDLVTPSSSSKRSKGLSAKKASHSPILGGSPLRKLRTT